MATFTSSTFLGGAGRFKISDNSWANCRGGASSEENFATYEVQSSYIAADPEDYIIQRVFLPIDTSTIPATATITSVTLNFNGNYEGGATGTTVHLVLSTQATTGSRDNADYNNLEFTSGGSVAVNNSSSTAKSITGNATALTWIVKEGTTKLALISASDQANSAPAGLTHWCTISSPQLVVAYTLPTTATGHFYFM